MSKQNLSPEIISLIEDTFDNSINNYEITIHANDGGGQGYLGEMVCNFYIYFSRSIIHYRALFVSN